jgi:hypothetical protein
MGICARSRCPCSGEEDSVSPAETCGRFFSLFLATLGLFAAWHANMSPVLVLHLQGVQRVQRVECNGRSAWSAVDHVDHPSITAACSFWGAQVRREEERLGDSRGANKNQGSDEPLC